MGIIDRLSSLMRSNINDLISRAEDPEKMLNQIIIDMKLPRYLSAKPHTYSV